ncbi:FAD-dependent monooxygenase [Streptomyces sp. NPDC050560]|uniref:FAD-dependent monooxygenase n=1 Tax=Streptomyces sp. NPDC050560 TaxID=3365630 RepID=UPI0037B3AEF3
MHNEVRVLIVGGGLVGLSLAVFLADQGVAAHVVERRPGTSALPRGRSLNVRSMEVLSSAGLAPALHRAPASVLRDFPEIARARTLDGQETFHAVRPAPDSYARVSPTAPLMIDQNAVEPVLRAHASRLGCRLGFHTELRSFSQDMDGVTAHLFDRASGRTSTVRAAYLVGADGHHSRVREELGIGVDGGAESTRYVSVPFGADLEPALRGRRLALCYLERPAAKTVLTRLDDPRRWVLMVPAEAAGDDPSDRMCASLVRQAVGRDDVEIELLRRDDVPLDRWELTSWVARSYRDRRVLLAGDAAHVTPPAGGLGGNTGIQDAHNLAWKLAAVLGGRAGGGLLDTYEAERRPVAVAAGAFSAASQRGRTGTGGAHAPGPVDPLAVALGYRYRSAAVAGDEGGGPAGSDPAPVARWDGEPGSRAPHVPLRRDGVPGSSLDLYRDRFVLLAGPGAGRWAEAVRQPGLPVPVRVHQVGADLDVEPDSWAEAHGVTGSGALLVRPDGFVCWRARGAAPADAAGRLAGVLRRALALDAEPAASAGARG